MSDFKDHLWRELVREHGAELAQTPAPASRSRRRRPRVLAGTTVGLAGLGTTLALALSAAGTSPAFAVTRNHDGTWSVTVRTLDAIPLANARLAAQGVRARLVAVADGCGAPIPAKVWAQGSETLVHGIRFDAKQIPAGKTLVVAAFRAGARVEISPAHLVPGTAPRCLPPVITQCLLGKAAAIHALAGTASLGNSGSVTARPTFHATSGNSGAVITTPTPSELKPIAAAKALAGAEQGKLSCRSWSAAAPLPANTGNSGASTSTTGNSGASTSTTGNSGASTSTTGNSGS
jgi:hypothetical protein